MNCWQFYAFTIGQFAVVVFLIVGGFNVGGSWGTAMFVAGGVKLITWVILTNILYQIRHEILLLGCIPLLKQTEWRGWLKAKTYHATEERVNGRYLDSFNRSRRNRHTIPRALAVDDKPQQETREAGH